MTGTGGRFRRNTQESFKRIKHVRDSDKEITGIEFLLACINRHQGYFEIRMCRINSLFEVLDDRSSIGISPSDYDYILRNVLKCYNHRIVSDFLEEFDFMWYDLSMVPDISVPLTAFGTETIEYLYDNIDKYLDSTNYVHIDVPNMLSLAEYISSNAQQSSDRIDASDRLAEVPK